MTACAEVGQYGVSVICDRPQKSRLIVTDGDGYRLTADGYTVYTDRSGVPLRLVGGRYDLQLSTFEGR